MKTELEFDSADASTGALCVVPGSHKVGILSGAQIAETRLDSFRACCASAGDVLLMRPLLLHRSSPSQAAGHRRVLHVIYAVDQAGDRLQWRDST